MSAGERSFDVPAGAQVCVIGAGLMGIGIAQIASQGRG